MNNIGDIDVLIELLKVNIHTGLNENEVSTMRNIFGTNVFPEAPSQSFLQLLYESLCDTTLIVLMIAAIVSIILGVIIEDPKVGWIEGFAIMIAVFLVSIISSK